MLYGALKRARIQFRYHDAKASFLEGVFARGDRQLGKVILKPISSEQGLMDGWSSLNTNSGLKRLKSAVLTLITTYTAKMVEVPLPWDHISCDIPKRWFKKEWERATAERTTPDCLNISCSTCGACDYDGVRNVLFERTRTEGRLNMLIHSGSL